MAERNFTTRVYKYGAVPLGKFPEEGINSLFKANSLWNNLVEVHNDNHTAFDKARRGVNKEYKRLSAKLDGLKEKIDKAFDAKRTARMKAGTRSATDPLIKAANHKIDQLKDEQREIWEEIKPHRKQATDAIYKKSLNADFRERVNIACRVKNTNGLDRTTADEVGRNFREARKKFFKSKKSRLRFHPFDGTGYWFYRFRDERIKSITKDGVRFSDFTPRSENDGRAFLLEPGTSRGGAPRLKLRIKVAGGNRKDGKIYANFDLVMHRPIPDGSQINNAKLMRRRVADRFKYTVNFSVRVPVASTMPVKSEAIGVDIGFRGMTDGTVRAATIGSTSDKFPFKTVELSREYMKRIDHVESLQSHMDDSAAKLGNAIKPLLKGGSILSEDHKHYKRLKAVAAAPSNRTMSFEQAYKLGSWFRNEPDTLPRPVHTKLMDWWDTNARTYREMHHLKKKTLGWRKEKYRILASRLVSHGLPIGMEKINLGKVFAEVKDADNELKDAARRQRFLVSISELRLAIKNAADREGVPFFKVNPRNTSKMCNKCGKVNKKLKSELNWTCPGCGVFHDRDENATVNIARLTLKKMADQTSKS